MNNGKGIFYALSAVGMSATVGVGFKLSVTHMDAFPVAIYIQLFASAALFAYLLWRKKAGLILAEFRRQPIFFLTMGVLGLGAQQIIYLKAYQLLPAVNVVLLFYTYPLLMVIFSWLVFQERVSIISAISLLLGFFGVSLLLAGKGASLNWGPGVWMSLLASATWALFCVFIKHKQFDVEIGMFLFNFFGFLFMLGCLPLRADNFAINLQELMGLSYLAIFPTAFALTLWNRALHLVKTSICSNIALLTPLLSVMIIMVVLKEHLHFQQAAGFLVVVGSVLLNLNSQKPAAAME
jgi:drug/metabolite transporter (DMT)-like permease